MGVVYKPDTEMASHYKKTNIDKEFNILIFFNHSNFLKSPVFDNQKKILNHYLKEFKLICSQVFY